MKNAGVLIYKLCVVYNLFNIVLLEHAQPEECPPVPSGTCSRGAAMEPTTARNGHPETYFSPPQVCEKHPEDHSVHEDGVSCKVHSGGERVEGSTTIRCGVTGLLRTGRGQRA